MKIAFQSANQVAGGEYLHIGFRDSLLKKLEPISSNKVPQYIEIDFSTDGWKLDRSGSWQFRPRQFRILNISNKKPLIVGVFKGRHKPSNAYDFYYAFITKLNEVIQSGGIAIRYQRRPIQI